MKKDYKIGIMLVLVGTASMVAGSLLGFEGPAFIVGIILIIVGALFGGWFIG